VDKVRIFFIVSLLQHLFTMGIFKPFHEHVCNYLDNFISFTWYYGKYLQFYEYMFASVTGYTYYTFDVGNKDNTANVPLLIIYLTLAMEYCKPQLKRRDVNALFIRIVFAWIVKHTTTHTVEWFSEIWKLVVGTLFSGDYNTSHFNTVSMQLMFRAWKIHLFQKGYITIDMLDPMTSAFRLAVQGDNGVLAVRDDLIEYVNVEAFRVFIEEHYHHVLKDITTSKNFFSTVDQCGELLTSGPFFLQRYFLPEGPFRPTSVYLKKILGHTSNMTPTLVASKCIGLAYDTHGTNPYAYGLLKRVHELLSTTVNMNVSLSPEDRKKMERKRKFVYGLEENHVGDSFPDRSYITYLLKDGKPRENSLYHSDHEPRDWKKLKEKQIY